MEVVVEIRTRVMQEGKPTIDIRTYDKLVDREGGTFSGGMLDFHQKSFGSHLLAVGGELWKLGNSRDE